MLKRMTMHDVASEAGVGIATVSRALRDKGDVSEATRQLVREAAQRIGYRPSGLARALRTGDYRVIAAIVPDDIWGWWEPVTAAAVAAAAARGYRLDVHPIAGIEGGPVAVINDLAVAPPDGFIVLGLGEHQGVRDTCDKLNIPVVAVDDSADEVLFPTVSVENWKGAYDVTRHLIQTGARAIVLLSGGEGFFLRERLRGYRDALDDAGIPFDAELVLDCADAGDESQTYRPELARLLDSRKVIDGVFCVADMMAPSALRTIRKSGLSVPDDIRVAGFDDERAALLVDPQLTTFRQPYSKLAKRAVDLLLRQIDRENVPLEREQLPGELVVRASTTGTN